MDAETQSHIFEPFFTTKEQGKGTGLGLATVYGIVKQSDGDLWVYSEPGRGTTFKIYLPVAKETGDLLEAQASADVPPIGTETILLVEDEALVRTLTKQVLELNGYTVLEAHRGDEALALCKQQPDINLLLTDVIMPGGMNGRELAERLQSLYPELKILYMSGYTNDIIVHHGVFEKGIHFLQKPFSPNTLVRKVREVLDMPLEKKAA
jgi:CheY-like chemotaxis protein